MEVRSVGALLLLAHLLQLTVKLSAERVEEDDVPSLHNEDVRSHGAAASAGSSRPPLTAAAPPSPKVLVLQTDVASAQHQEKEKRTMTFKVNSKGSGCSNWLDIRFGQIMRDTTVDRCAERCINSSACVGFGYQHSTICDKGGLGRPGTCFLWSGACIPEKNACWDDHSLIMTSEDQKKRSDAWKKRLQYCNANLGSSLLLQEEKGIDIGALLQPKIIYSPAPSPTLSTRHRPACFFVNALWTKPNYRDRSYGVAKTWGRAEFVPKDARLFYLVGAGHMDPFPGMDEHLIRNDQLVVFSTDFDPENVTLPIRMRSTLVTIHQRFKDECSWFIDVDDDSYVNMTLIMNKLRCIDNDTPHFMGPIYHSNTGPFVHGSLKVFSEKALIVLREAIVSCSLPCGGWDDVVLGECLRRYQRNANGLPEEVMKLQPTSFGRTMHNNSVCNQTTDDCKKSALRLVSKTTIPECLDVIHKVVGSDAMQALHDKLRGRKHCSLDLDNLLMSVDSSMRLAARDRCEVGRPNPMYKPQPLLKMSA